MATLERIRARVLSGTDNEYTDGFVESDEVDELINVHYQELYELLVTKGLHRPETEFPITANGSALYPLPVYYGILSVHRVLADGSPLYLTMHDHRDKPGPHKAEACSYRVVNSSVEFIPTPQTGQYVVTYIPRPTLLVNDSDELDGVLGWEEFVVLATQLEVIFKEAIDPAMLQYKEAKLGRIRARVESAVRNREMSERPRIADVRRHYDDPDLLVRSVRPVSWRWW